MRALREEDTLNNMDKLLLLPVIGYDFQAEDTGYPEPFYFLELTYTKRLPDGFDRSSWDIPIRKLIEIVEKGSSKAREIAIFRLTKINHIDAWANKEKDDFAKALWSKTDDEFHLAVETGLSTFSLLYLPSPSEVIAIDLIKKWVLKSAISQEINTFPNYSIKNYFETLIELAKKDTFSNKELLVILEKLDNWVEKACKGYSQLRVSSPGIGEDYIINYFKYVKKILNTVIYPNINNGVEVDERRNLIEHIIQKLKSVEIPILSVKPGMLIFYKDKYNKTVSNFKRSLVSRKEEEIREALEGIYFWLFLKNERKDFPTINKILINDLFNKVLNRRKPGLLDSILITSSILGNFPGEFREEQVNILCEALELLLEECEIPQLTEIGSCVDGNILELRKEASKLALSIKNWFEKIKKEPPCIIKEWEKSAKSDFLPEVWKIWE